MVGTGARTRLRTHEVEPSRDFLRCLPVARPLKSLRNNGEGGGLQLKKRVAAQLVILDVRGR